MVHSIVGTHLGSAIKVAVHDLTLALVQRVVFRKSQLQLLEGQQTVRRQTARQTVAAKTNLYPDALPHVVLDGKAVLEQQVSVVAAAVAVEHLCALLVVVGAGWEEAEHAIVVHVVVVLGLQ